jgi:hypothetical protein
MPADLLAEINDSLGERQVPTGFQMTDIRGEETIAPLDRLKTKSGPHLSCLAVTAARGRFPRTADTLRDTARERAVEA